MKGFDFNNKTILGIKESMIINSEKIVNGLDESEKQEVLKNLNEVLKALKEMQYDNCSVSDFEALLDEELIYDLVINKGNLDIETAGEVVLNKEAYLKGEHTFKKLVDNILNF